MEHGFSPVSHHGPKPYGGTEAAGMEYGASAEATKTSAAAAAPRAAGNNDESINEPKHVRRDTKYETNNRFNI